MDSKHVVCIMPTVGREVFARHSVEMFRRQTHEPKTLVIVNSGERYDLADGDDVFQVMRAAEPDEAIAPQESVAERKAGAYEGGWWSLLRNVRRGIAEARAMWPHAHAIAMWEDDDYYHHDRLAAQVDGLGDADAHGWSFAYWYHAVYRQMWFDSYEGKATPNLALNTSTMVGRRLAYQRQFLWDGMFWQVAASRGRLDSDASWVPFVAVKHGIGPTINNGHLREECDARLDDSGADWFRHVVDLDSFAFYDGLRTEAMAHGS